jgi:hypothetical protein
VLVGQLLHVQRFEDRIFGIYALETLFIFLGRCDLFAPAVLLALEGCAMAEGGK